MQQQLVFRSARALEALSHSIRPIEEAEPVRQAITSGIERGIFRPEEDDAVRKWFARFLTVRGGLWELIAELGEGVGWDVRSLESDDDWRCFVLGFASACLLVRIDRFLIGDFARHTLIQRKLNEGAPELRIPRKQFTEVFESLSDPVTALVLFEAMKHKARHRSQIARLRNDPLVGFAVQALPEWETSLDPSKCRFVKTFLRFGQHSVRRWAASTRQQTIFAALESSGRIAAEIRNPLRERSITSKIRERIASHLQPGDVMVTRREHAFTNLFLPGYWPHAALYVGSQQDRERLGVQLDPERQARWTGDRRVLEALKDGVLFRPLEETLQVDAVAVIRPRMGGSQTKLAEALGRAATHEGKLYNFDFDFFRSDRLVCTEVVYRAFDGLGGTQFPLRERAGRPTLSAEDLLDLALEGEYFEPVALFGTPASLDEVVTGPGLAAVLADSYREPV